jgi:hypothetical protein
MSSSAPSALFDGTGAVSRADVAAPAPPPELPGPGGGARWGLMTLIEEHPQSRPVLEPPLGLASNILVELELIFRVAGLLSTFEGCSVLVIAENPTTFYCDSVTSETA